MILFPGHSVEVTEEREQQLYNRAVTYRLVEDLPPATLKPSAATSSASSVVTPASKPSQRITWHYQPPYQQPALFSEIETSTQLPPQLVSLVYNYYRPIDVPIPRTYNVREIDPTDSKKHSVAVYQFSRPTAPADSSGNCGIRMGNDAPRCEGVPVLKCVNMTTLKRQELYLCERHAFWHYLTAVQAAQRAAT